MTFTTAAPDALSEGAAIGLREKLAGSVVITVDGKGKLSYTAEIERFAPVLEHDGRIGFQALFVTPGDPPRAFHSPASPLPSSLI